jgi:hypothetical protein
MTEIVTVVTMMTVPHRWLPDRTVDSGTSAMTGNVPVYGIYVTRLKVTVARTTISQYVLPESVTEPTAMIVTVPVTVTTSADIPTRPVQEKAADYISIGDLIKSAMLLTQGNFFGSVPKDITE